MLHVHTVSRDLMTSCQYTHQIWKQEKSESDKIFRLTMTSISGWADTWEGWGTYRGFVQNMGWADIRVWAE